MRNSRRKLLKWSAPIISTVILPAHAQTSVSTSSTSSTSSTTSSTPITSASITINSVTPNSGAIVVGVPITINVTYTVINPPPVFEGSIFASLIQIGALVPVGGGNVGLGSPLTLIDNTSLSGTIDIIIPNGVASGEVINAPGPVTADTVTVLISGNSFTIPVGSFTPFDNDSSPVTFTFN